MSGLPPTLSSPAILREHLHIAAGHPELKRIAGGRRHAGPQTPAAVLIAIVQRGRDLNIILTKRTEHLKAHAGQISFPGGRMEPEDINAPACALREAQEEIGLPPQSVDVLGGLSTYETGTGFRVYPIVGWISKPVEYAIDPFEVAEVFEVPVAFLIDSANHKREMRMRGNERRNYFAIPYGDRYIWGATAAMLVGFSRLLHTDFNAQPEPDAP